MTQKNRNINYRAFILTTLLILFCFHSIAQDFKTVKDLKGQWKFSIGDNLSWAEPEFDDSNWETIKVPGAWEMDGFNGYDGYAWYRKTFNLSKSDNKQNYYLELGYIDDVDEVYVNGTRIGRTGSFPPDYSTAYNAHRMYIVPNSIINTTSYITIAIRVFDEGREGGIVHGKVSLSVDENAIHPDLSLQGEWKFKTGNCGNPSEELIDFSAWANIIVPGTWEDQGYKNYDGMACYSIEFNLLEQFKNEKMVLLLGKIDDLDMVYLNGVLIGQSGDFSAANAMQRSEMYKQLRGYYIPDDVLNHHGLNMIIVKVYDHNGVGGIWDGDIGLITQENYIAYWRRIKNSNR